MRESAGAAITVKLQDGRELRLEPLTMKQRAEFAGWWHEFQRPKFLQALKAYQLTIGQELVAIRDFEFAWPVLGELSRAAQTVEGARKILEICLGGQAEAELVGNLLDQHELAWALFIGARLPQEKNDRPDPSGGVTMAATGATKQTGT